MHGLTDETRRVIADLAQQYGISHDAVLAMLMAVKRGQGSMAQFNIAELGGNGQWMQGGMTMVGDMFNYGLKNTVDGLCNALSQALFSGRIDLPDVTGAGGGSAWWPQWLGSPSSAGAQNDSAYAVFPSHHRLAVRQGTAVSLYDTGDHFISGVGQQQGSNTGLSFSSQYGSFAVNSLRRVEDDGVRAEASAVAPALPMAASPPAPAVFPQMGTFAPAVASDAVEATPAVPAETPAYARPQAAASTPAADSGEILGLIEKLAALRDAGILTDAEFSAKKTELLARL